MIYWRVLPLTVIDLVPLVSAGFFPQPAEPDPGLEVAVEPGWVVAVVVTTRTVVEVVVTPPPLQLPGMH
jgi:hypothetical protein